MKIPFPLIVNSKQVKVPDIGQRNARNVAIWGDLDLIITYRILKASVSLCDKSRQSLCLFYTQHLYPGKWCWHESVSTLSHSRLLSVERRILTSRTHKISILSSCVGQRQDLDNCWSPALDLWPKMWQFAYLVYLA